MTPYRTLLSELMLQQTRVETVLPYFARFVARWPTLEDLADAPDDEVLREWAGLGYYSRARNLLAAVRSARAMGGLPPEAEQLRLLPGIGPYTAGAIASQAFGRRAAIVDGNVERVLCRLDAFDGDPRATAGRRRVWARAAELVEASRDPSAFNQGLMEIGATVCLPRNAACGRCPIASACVALAEDRVAALPMKKKKAPPAAVEAVAGRWERGGAVLLGERPPGLLGGLWEPIGDLRWAGEDPTEAVARAFATRVGVEVQVGAELGVVVHKFTHRTLTLRVFAVSGDEEPTSNGSYPRIRWIAEPFSTVALSTLARRALALGEPLEQVLPLAADSTPKRGAWGPPDGAAG